MFRRARAVDVVVGTRPSGGSLLLVDEALRTAIPPDRRQPLRRRVVSPGDDAAGGPGQGLRDHHRGLQRLLRVLRGAADPWARADAPEGGDPGGGSARRSRAVGPKSTCSGRSSTTTRRPTIPACDFAALAGGRGRRARHPEDPLREPASAARHARAHRAPCATLPHVCKHLHLPVQSGSTRILAGDAAAAHPRGVPGSGARR